MPARLKDIANDLGLSVVTISKVLRNHPDIGEATRKRVLKRMKELDYQPNLAARSLITGQTWTIGLVVPDLLHPFFAQIAKLISAEVRKKGYSLFISSSDGDPDLERQEIKQLLARRVDVMLIASAQWTIETFRQIEQQKIPYILLDRQLAGLECNFVGVDDRAVGVLATSHLAEQGCKRIAHIRGPEVSTAIGRLDGYRPVRSGLTVSSASTIRLPWAPCALSSMPACASRKMSPWWAAEISPIPTFFVSPCLQWTRAARSSVSAPPHLLWR